MKPFYFYDDAYFLKFLQLHWEKCLFTFSGMALLFLF